MERSTFWHRTIQDNGELYSEASRQTLLANLSPDLQSLFLSRLPPELRSYIWDYVPSTTAYNVFLLVAGETSQLARHLRDSTNWVLGFDDGSRFVRRSRFSTPSMLTYSKSPTTESKSNLQIFVVVIGLKFVTNLNGICAMKLLGYDWESDWLDKIPDPGRVWYEIIQGMLPGTRCHYNVNQHLVYDGTFLLTSKELEFGRDL
jgi:hypothetical protein